MIATKSPSTCRRKGRVAVHVELGDPVVAVDHTRAVREEPALISRKPPHQCQHVLDRLERLAVMVVAGPPRGATVRPWCRGTYRESSSTPDLAILLLESAM